MQFARYLGYSFRTCPPAEPIHTINEEVLVRRLVSVRPIVNHETGDSLGNDKQPLTGFSWRGGSECDTTGILMWSDIFCVDAPKSLSYCSIHRLGFCLPPSAWATMMLRELMKCDTSASGQTILEEAALQKAFGKDVKEIKKKAWDIIEAGGASDVKQAKLKDDGKEGSVDKAEVSNKI
uniref:Guanylate-binding protein N-terminal domain-containing protein n=1 Tax=Glossina brevipalpis TaxID=37001 RepID=A0A1A9WQE9_9MUSC